jgi:hypothetical protein
MSLGRMEAGLYNFQLPKSGDVSNVMTGIAFVAAVTHGEPGEEAEGEAEVSAEPTPYSFWNVTPSRAKFTLVDGPPNRMPDRISFDPSSPASPQFNRAPWVTGSGQRIYSFYWDAPELGGMYRQSNHWGSLGTSNWSLEGPNGWVASPDKFTMFPTNMPTL